MITVNAENKIEINFEVLRSKPKVISLMEKINQYGIDIDKLNTIEINKILSLFLITSR